jgi:glycosyltransferase involved in cell wall biosynthesis
VYHLQRRSGLNLGSSNRLASLLRRERVDVIHAHQFGPFFYGATARLLARRPGLVMTEHGRSFPDPPRRAHFLFNRAVLRRGDRIIAVGEDVRRALIDNEGFPAGRVEVVYNGVDTGSFAESARHRESVRREIGVGAEELVLMQVARLDAIKDHATAVRAVRRVAERRGDVRLVIVGDGAEAGPIDELTRDLGLGDRVLRLGTRTDVTRLIGAADVVMLTSRSEGIPLTLIEGMAAGLPVVATRVGGIPEVVAEGETGLLAPAGDADALAAHILRLAEDRDLRGRLGRAGRERARTSFDEGRMIAAYDRIYGEAAGLAAGVRRPRLSAARGT